MSSGSVVLLGIVAFCAIVGGELVTAFALFKRLEAMDRRHQEEQRVSELRSWYDRLRHRMVLDALHFLLESNNLLRRPPHEESGRPREETRP